MKYVIVIPDGCADLPLDDLGGKTPLEVAKIPNMHQCAQAGWSRAPITCPLIYRP